MVVKIFFFENFLMKIIGPLLSNSKNYYFKVIYRSCKVSHYFLMLINYKTYSAMFKKMYIIIFNIFFYSLLVRKNILFLWYFHKNGPSI